MPVKGWLPMFDVKDLESLDPGYFNIIMANEYDVTVMSRNTGHYWYVHCTGVPGDMACIMFHKHKYNHPYHQHGHGNSLRQAITSIQSHDMWQMNGRKR